MKKILIVIGLISSWAKITVISIRLLSISIFAYGTND